LTSPVRSDLIDIIVIGAGRICLVNWKVSLVATSGRVPKRFVYHPMSTMLQKSSVLSRWRH